ncbi:SPX domain-containing protein [Mycotypha africana]|uniref:SPX domain-containing protein n=1 Tax=Mycotypha africana TaxID=64632 RepID=UPI002300D3C3|nr:SPX domain-containing protein [Mycotypha africana]KAI8977416.1 SPX domain-containing protein [Mycotypha africana]
MKFGKQMETASFDLPENWRPHLIHYKILKKSIRLIVDELEQRGLSSEWLNTLDTEEAMRLDYIFDGDAKDPHPYIRITIEDPAVITTDDKPAVLKKLIPITQKLTTEPLSIKIELVRDSEFFHLLLHELSHAAALHEKEKERFGGDVDKLEGQLTIAASPQKKDFQQQLEWFTAELSRMSMTKRLSSKSSKMALTQFLAINAQLVHFKHFQALNQTAMRKILKKHDKRSGLRL